MARLLAREVRAVRDTLRGWAASAGGLWARRRDPRRAVAVAFVAAAALSGALALVAQARLPGRLPAQRDWAALAALIERDARPGDAVVLSPPWAERAREVLPASVPVLASARYAGEALLGVRRVWVLSVPRAPGFTWEAELDLVERGSRSDPDQRVGAFTVARYELASPALPLAFLPDRLHQAEVFLDGEPCPPDAHGFHRCDGARVAREVRDAGGAPRPCLVAALQPGAPLTISFPQVRLGRVVRGHAATLAGDARPLRVSVLVDGEEAGAAEISGGGFSRFHVDTARFGGQTRRVSLVLATPDHAEVCLDAATLP